MKNNISKMMGKLFEASDNKSRNDRASVGIGTLIVFIAMVLVAAVAASVLMQTSETISGKARQVVTQATNEITNGVWVRDLYGYTDPAKEHINYIGIVIKLLPGSTDMDLSQTKIIIKADELKILSFYKEINNTAADITGTDNVFEAINLTNITDANFGIIGIQDADGSLVNAFGLGREDRAMLVMNLTAIYHGDIPREGIDVELMPPFGTPLSYNIEFPLHISHRIVDLTQ